MHDLSALDSAAAPPRVTEFVEWSRAELTLREASFSHDRLERRFVHERIFGSDD